MRHNNQIIPKHATLITFQYELHIDCTYSKIRLQAVATANATVDLSQVLVYQY